MLNLLWIRFNKIAKQSAEDRNGSPITTHPLNANAFCHRCQCTKCWIFWEFAAFHPAAQLSVVSEFGRRWCLEFERLGVGNGEAYSPPKAKQAKSSSVRSLLFCLTCVREKMIFESFVYTWLGPFLSVRCFLILRVYSYLLTYNFISISALQHAYSRIPHCASAWQLFPLSCEFLSQYAI